MNPSYQAQAKAIIRADRAMTGNQLHYFEIGIMEDAKDKSVARAMFSLLSLF